MHGTSPICRKDQSGFKKKGLLLVYWQDLNVRSPLFFFISITTIHTYQYIAHSPSWYICLLSPLPIITIPAGSAVSLKKLFQKQYYLKNKMTHINIGEAVLVTMFCKVCAFETAATSMSLLK
jgi:hypothetical protein